MPELPADFTFGVATAAYQIEGAVAADGRGRSVWDDFCDQPGRIVDGSSGAVACDSYHRYAEDVALMSRLGVDSYRFSISWPRVLPAGTGRVNAAGLDYYDRLVDALLAQGIQPAATLFHWDLPAPLEADGGWLQRDTAEAFADYARVVAERLADRVAMWMPVNEPNVVTTLGYSTGMHAPGRTLGLYALPVAHHLLLGHGLAVGALRAAGAASVGSAQNHTIVWPSSDREQDRAAADLFDTVFNRLYADPVLLGRYPEGLGEMMPGPVEQDLRIISAPLDFYGFNYYNPTRVGSPHAGEVIGATVAADLPFAIHEIEGYPRTDFGWPVVPEGLLAVLRQLRDRYGERLPPLYLTENGCAYDTGPDAEGIVDDTERIAFYDGHLNALAEGIREGIDVRGYFAWSLLDNFEWAEGYTKRFGLVHMDFETQDRIPKQSFHWYADLIRRTKGR
ncbi:GH1 family beta-glucosidase [Nostocoides sp.]|uniref:GH1 family beta-glucosidase n=1 Tax=Nostocoides sp. TaxID=1917966 RepID=UPI002C375623|nr:GH1 family beta-glucosidase [Tetrasphaera sp.]